MIKNSIKFKCLLISDVTLIMKSPHNMFNNNCALRHFSGILWKLI